ncbi:MAG: decaprenyl-phosphate phosphoribosyltransferase [Kofleriaceae bacterium]
MSPAVALLKTIRPHQWVKNVFVAAPLVFARHLTESDYLWRTAIAVLAFSLLSGAVYAFNDVRDVEADRAHPTKKLRPIAAGHLSERGALVAAGVLAAIALAGAFALSWKLGVVASIYGAQNVAYSIRLKHIAFVDVASIALGFILRVLAGAYAIDVPASGWLILCTALLATFLGLGKRGHELAWAEKAGGATSSTRAALSGYSLPSLRLAMYVLAAATCAAYVAYTLDAHTIEMFATERLVLSAPFVGLAIVRFLSLALWHPKDESPTEAMLKDPWFLLALVAAVATIVYVIYGHRLGG